jgi:hypothetical protein
MAATAGLPQTRQQIHLAIYDQRLPHFYKGKLERDGKTWKSDAQDDWRYVVNTLYNYNLSRQLALQPVVNTDWFPVSQALQGYLKNCVISVLNRHASLPLATPFIGDHVTVEFVLNTRAEKAFWDSLLRVYGARTNHDRSRALSEHLQFLSERFARYLVDTKGQRSLVQPVEAELWSGRVDISAGFCYGATLFLAMVLQLPLDQVANLLEVEAAMHFVVRGAVKRLHPPKFKSAMAEFGQIGRTLFSDV